jgi:hypothetical protein
VFTNALTALLACDEYTQQNHTVLVDALDMTASKVTGKRIFHETKRLAAYENRMAIVMKDGRGLGVARIFEICSNATSNKVAVFTDLDAAHDWLELARVP